MKVNILPLFCAAILTAAFSSCSTFSSSSHADHAKDIVSTTNVSYNELTMDLDPNAVSYTIDVSTPEGRLKLNKISLRDAEHLALVECLIKYNCATLFNPQFTHLKKGKHILRVTVYGYPARYKAKELQVQPEPKTSTTTNINIHN